MNLADLWKFKDEVG